MAQFKVIMKRVTYAETTIEATSAAEVREMLKQPDADLDYFLSASGFWSDDMKVVSVKRETAEA